MSITMKSPNGSFFHFVYGVCHYKEIFSSNLVKQIKSSLMVSAFKNLDIGTSLVVHWVRLCASNAGGPGSIPGQGTRSRTHAATKSSHAAMKTPHAATKTGAAKINK